MALLLLLVLQAAAAAPTAAKRGYLQYDCESLGERSKMCDICIEVEGGDGDSILASAQVVFLRAERAPLPCEA